MAFLTQKMALLWVYFCALLVLVQGNAVWLSYAKGPNTETWTPNMPIARAARGGGRRFQLPASTLRPPVPPPPQFSSARFIQPLSPAASGSSRKVPLPPQPRSQNIPRKKQDAPKQLPRPVLQQAGHLHDSWPNTNAHHLLSPAESRSWPSKIRLSNTPLTLTNTDTITQQDLTKSHLSPQQKEKIIQMTNTLTKLSPKKPINVFMREEGIAATRAGADVGQVIKKYAGSSKVPFFNGTLPSSNLPPVFLAPDDLFPPTGYGKIPIPSLKKDQPLKSAPNEKSAFHLVHANVRVNADGNTARADTPKTFLGPADMAPPPGYTKILLPHGISQGKASTHFEHQSQLGNQVNTKTLNTLSMEEKMRIIQALRQGKSPLLSTQKVDGDNYESAYRILKAPHQHDPMELLKGVLPKGAIVESITNLGKDAQPQESLLRPTSSMPKQLLMHQSPFSMQQTENKENMQLLQQQQQQQHQQQQQFQAQQHINQGQINQQITQQFTHNSHSPNSGTRGMQPTKHLTQPPQSNAIKDNVLLNPGIHISLPQIQDGGLNEVELKRIIGAIVKQTEGPSSTTPMSQVQGQLQTHAQTNQWKDFNQNTLHTQTQQQQQSQQYHHPSHNQHFSQTKHFSSQSQRFPQNQQTQLKTSSQNQQYPPQTQQFTPKQEFHSQAQQFPGKQQFPSQTQQFQAKQQFSSQTQQFQANQQFPSQTQQFQAKQQFPSQTQQFQAKQQFPSQTQQFQTKQQFPSQSQQHASKQKFPSQTQQFPLKQQIPSPPQQRQPSPQKIQQSQQNQNNQQQNQNNQQQNQNNQQQNQNNQQQTQNNQQQNQNNQQQTQTTQTRYSTPNGRPSEEQLHLQKQTILFSSSQPPKNLFPQGPPTKRPQPNVRTRMPVLIPAPATPAPDVNTPPQPPLLLQTHNQRHSKEEHDRGGQKPRTPLQTALAFLGIQSTPSPQLKHKPKPRPPKAHRNHRLPEEAHKGQHNLPTKEQEDSDSAESVQESREKDRPTLFKKRPTTTHSDGEKEKFPDLRRIITSVNDDDDESRSEEESERQHRFPSSPTPRVAQQATYFPLPSNPQPPAQFQHLQNIVSSTPTYLSTTRYPSINPFAFSQPSFSTHSQLPFHPSTQQTPLNALFTQPQLTVFSSTPFPLHNTPRPSLSSPRNPFSINKPQHAFSPHTFQDVQLLPYSENNLHAAAIQNVIRHNMGLRINPPSFIYNPTQGTLTQGTLTQGTPTALIPIQLTNSLPFNHQPGTVTYTLVPTPLPVTTTTTQPTTTTTPQTTTTAQTTTYSTTPQPTSTTSFISNNEHKHSQVEKSETSRKESQHNTNENAEDKVIEKVRTEEKIIWNGSVPSKIRTEERTIIRPQQSRINQVKGDHDQQQHSDHEQKYVSHKKKADRQRYKPRPPEPTPTKNAEQNHNEEKPLIFHADHFQQHQKSQSIGTSSQDQNQFIRYRDTTNSFAELLASKMRFEKMKEQLYPHQSIYAQPQQHVNQEPTQVWPPIQTLPTPFAPTVQTTIDPNGRHRIRPGDLGKSDKMTPISAITPSVDTLKQHSLNIPHLTQTLSSEQMEQTGKMTYPYQDRSPLYAQPHNNEKLIFLPSSPTREATEEKRQEERLLFFPSPSTMPTQNAHSLVDTSQTKENLHTHITQDMTLIQETPIWEPFRLEPQHTEAIAFNSLTTEPTTTPTTTTTTPIPKTTTLPTTTTPMPSTTTEPTTTSTTPTTTTARQELQTTTIESLQTITETSEAPRDDTRPITWRPTLSYTQAPTPLSTSPTKKQKVTPFGAETLYALMRGLSDHTADRADNTQPQDKDLGATLLYAVAKGVPQQTGEPPSMQMHYHNPMLMTPMQSHPILLQTHPYQMQFQQFPYDVIQPQHMHFFSQTHLPMPTQTTEEPIQKEPQNTNIEEEPNNYNYYHWEETQATTPAPTTTTTKTTTTLRPLDDHRPRYRNKYRIPTQHEESTQNTDRLIPVYVHKPRRHRQRTTTTSTTTTTTEQPSDEYDDTRENDTPSEGNAPSPITKATPASFVDYAHANNHPHGYGHKWNDNTHQPNTHVEEAKDVESSVDLPPEPTKPTLQTEINRALPQLQEEVVYEVRVKVPATTSPSRKINKYSSGSEEDFEFNPIYNTNFFQTPKPSTSITTKKPISTTTRKPRRRKTGQPKTTTSTTTTPIPVFEDSQSEESEEKSTTTTSAPQPQRRRRPGKRVEETETGSVLPPFKPKERVRKTSERTNIYVTKAKPVYNSHSNQESVTSARRHDSTILETEDLIQSIPQETPYHRKLSAHSKEERMGKPNLNPEMFMMSWEEGEENKKAGFVSGEDQTPFQIAGAPETPTITLPMRGVEPNSVLKEPGNTLGFVDEGLLLSSIPTTTTTTTTSTSTSTPSTTTKSAIQPSKKTSTLATNTTPADDDDENLKEMLKSLQAKIRATQMSDYDDLGSAMMDYYDPQELLDVLRDQEPSLKQSKGKKKTKDKRKSKTKKVAQSIVKKTKKIKSLKKEKQNPKPTKRSKVKVTQRKEIPTTTTTPLPITIRALPSTTTTTIPTTTTQQTTTQPITTTQPSTTTTSLPIITTSTDYASVNLLPQHLPNTDAHVVNLPLTQAQTKTQTSQGETARQDFPPKQPLSVGRRIRVVRRKRPIQTHLVQEAYVAPTSPLPPLPQNHLNTFSSRVGYTGESIRKKLKLVRKGNSAHWRLGAEEADEPSQSLPLVGLPPEATPHSTPPPPQKTMRMESSMTVETRVCVRGKCEVVTKN